MGRKLTKNIIFELKTIIISIIVLVLRLRIVQNKFVWNSTKSMDGIGIVLLFVKRNLMMTISTGMSRKLAITTSILLSMVIVFVCSKQSIPEKLPEN